MKKYINLFILSVIFFISFYLRLDAYFINNSFFTDEVLLFTNLFSRNYTELIQPLQFFQSAPYVFLILSKFISNHIGVTELCMRFIPLLSGLLSVFFFYKLTGLVFRSNLAKYIALFTFGINYQLLFYTQTFKQYSTDVLVIILFLYLILKYFKDIQSIKQYTVIGIISLFCIFTSFPMFIFIPAVYFTLLVYRKDALKLLYSALYPVIGLIVYYLFNLRFANHSVYLHNYWEKGFHIFNLELYKMNFDFLFSYYSFPVLLLIMLVAGLYFLYKNNKFLFCIFALTLINTLLLAYLKVYPFERRLILFLLPVVFIIMIYPLDNLKKNAISYIMTVISGFFLLFGYFNFSKNYISGKVSYLRQDVRPLLEKIINKDSTDKVYVYYGAVPTYSYYSLIYDLPKDIIFATFPGNEKQSEIFLRQDLRNLSGGNYYILFVKGTDTYEKDIKYIESWLKTNYEIQENNTLKSAKLIKVKIK